MRGFGADAQILVGKRRIVNRRHDRRFHVLQPFEAMERTLGLEGDQFDGRVELTQRPPGPHERAARAEAGDEMRQPAAGLVDDFRRGGVEVRAPVGFVAVLIRIEILLGVLGDGLPHFADLVWIQAAGRLVHD